MADDRKAIELTEENYHTHQKCMNCERVYPKYDLVWVSDNYGIPFKKVCNYCYDEVRNQIRKNHYGDELTHDELYGEDV
jgi:hypothetical protein